MKVLHVNNVDLYGRRFNGYDLIDALRPRGIESKQAVIDKLSRNPAVFELLSGPGDRELQYRLETVESRHSLDNILFPWGRVLAQTEEFAEADIVHYHLIHNHVISLLDFPWLTHLKPSVWTIHDPWALTGHCIYPKECAGWLEGCQNCPRLDAVFPMREDRASEMWRIKQRVLSEVSADVVVASDFMLDMVRRSPLESRLNRVHCIPFGVDTSGALPDGHRAASRRSLGIPQDDFVIFFRSTQSEVKGLRYIIDALSMTPPLRPTTLLTVEARGLVEPLRSDYSINEYGWVEDESMHHRLLSACDVFLMPSTAEAFGLMAVEAMGAGRPVICFEGTSLPAVTHAPDCGIAIPMGDAAALREAIDGLSSSPEIGAARGKLGRQIAASDYGQERYLNAIANLYESAASRPRHHAR